MARKEKKGNNQLVNFFGLILWKELTNITELDSIIIDYGVINGETVK